ncbi:MAG: AAA family ATPase [Methanotrichaceae archaeon]|nr:AAA family ATPase [Methanotrichaceae archaeon]
MPKEEAKIEGIGRISVEGFKSLAKPVSCEIRPLTILAGPNSSGKSSIMQPMLMMKQTLEASYDPGALLINGPNVRFTKVDQFLSVAPRKKKREGFIVKIWMGDDISIEETFKKAKGQGILIEEAIYADRIDETRLRLDMSHEDILAANPHLKPFFDRIAWMHGAKGTRIGLDVVRNRCFLEIAFNLVDESAGVFQLLQAFPEFPRLPGGESIESCIREMIHVPALRGNPRRNYNIAAVSDKFPGLFSEYVASVINSWQSAKDPRLEELRRDLEVLGLTWKVEVLPVDDTSVEIQVGRLQHATRGGAKDLVSIADVGFGLSQTLPVLVALLAAKPGQLVYIEQPEIHLHPSAQIAMAQVLATAASRGVRVVVETHSSLIIKGVQAIVAEGKLDPKIVKLHWFKRGPKTGVTEVFSADLDEAGRFGEWPEEFAQIELEVEGRYLDAAEARLRGS